MALQQVCELSKLWYRDRLSPDFHGRGPGEAAAIFRAAGLTAPFWHLGEPEQPG